MATERAKITFLILAVAVMAISTAAPLVRLAMDAAQTKGYQFSLFLAASRLIIATLLLLPFGFPLPRKTIPLRAYLFSIGAGICLALHFVTWIASLGLTDIALSTTLVTTTPLWVALIAWIIWQEQPTLYTIIGLGIALSGSLVMIANNPSTGGSSPLLGSFLAILAAIMASLYMLLGDQAQKQGLSLKHYITLAYSIAALFLLPFPLIWGHGYLDYSLPVYGYIFLMAIFAQLIGHTSLNWALRHLSPTVVGLTTLLEPVGASILGIWCLGEVPSLAVILGGSLILLGVAVALGK